MNSKYIFTFVMTLVIGSAFILFINSGSDIEVIDTPETTTTTVPETTTTTVQSTDTLGDEESVQIVDENEETPIAYDGEFLNFVGFEGNNQDKLDQLVLSLPQLLKDILKDKVIYVNGCHDYARSLVGRCPYGVWDSTGTNSDGSKGAEWSMSIWISNRAFDALQAEDVLIHESSHALSYLTRNCNTADNQSYRLDAWTLFGGEEKFADAYCFPHNLNISNVLKVCTNIKIILKINTFFI